MSHVVSIQCVISDLDAVKAVCAELGLTFKQNQKTYAWYGRHAGDYPCPDGFTVEDLGKCEHAIGVPGTAWEIGLARPRNGQGYRLLFDFYGTQGQPIKQAVGGENAQKFVQLYAVHAATKAAQRKGLTVRRVQLANGAINLVMTGPTL